MTDGSLSSDLVGDRAAGADPADLPATTGPALPDVQALPDVPALPDVQAPLPGGLDDGPGPPEDPDGTPVVRVAGDLDLHTGPALRSELLGRIAGGEHDLVVDMAAVSYLDSSGITVLISGLKAARAVGGTVRLARCRPVILQLLDLTGLSRVFLVYDTVEEALTDSLGRSPHRA